MSTVDESFEDWTLESRLSLKTSDDSTGLTDLDLVEVPLTGWGDEQQGNAIRLTREGAEWLRDALVDALEGVER